MSEVDQLQVLLNQNAAKYNDIRASLVVSGLTGEALDKRMADLEVQRQGVLTLKAERLVLEALRLEHKLRIRAESDLKAVTQAAEKLIEASKEQSQAARRLAEFRGKG